MKYSVAECNMARLEKKLTTIKNKCDKYGLDFHYEKCGEEFKELIDEDGSKYNAKFIIVEAEGKAIKSGWEFVATLEHHDKGNIIRGFGDREIPERYYNADCVCEHCKSKRKRKDTYIVYNEESGEFKQVGGNCLRDFTFGLDAEMVTAFISGFDKLIEGEAPYSGCHHERYFDIIEMLCYFNETIKHFGYVRNSDYAVDLSTSTRAKYYYDIEHGCSYLPSKIIEEYRKEMADVNFNAMSESNEAKAKDMIDWVRNNEKDNNYFHNLKVACSEAYINESNFGLIASIPASYDKNLEIQAEKRRREAEMQKEIENGKSSEYVGKVGDRIEFEVESARVLSTRYNEFGTTYFIKIVGKDGNVYVWSTSNGCVVEEAKRIKATIKGYNEYNGCKQTIITRGKVLE